MKLFLKLFGALIAVGVCTVIGVGFWGYQQLQPAVGDDSEMVRFVVRPGESVTSIANRLEENGLVRNALVFRITARALEIEKSIQAGSFELRASDSTQEIAQALTKGTQDTWITLPEGLRSEEIAEIVASNDTLSVFSKEEFLEASQGLEGTLYPDTYLVPSAITAPTLVSLLTNTFENKAAALDSELTADELVLASLIQREARTPAQMQLVSGILHNRISIGMPLQVDATLQYAKGQDPDTGKWWNTPLGVDRQLDSPFNTYQNPGLPPRPIANPGFDALYAVQNPAETDDLFYIHAPDGQMYTALTLDQHNENINQHLR